MIGGFDHPATNRHDPSRAAATRNINDVREKPVLDTRRGAILRILSQGRAG
jgi:hypothetical protein